MKKLLMVLVFGFIFAQVAQAEEHNWEYQGEKIRVIETVSVSQAFFSLSSEKSVPEELAKKGFFVVAGEGVSIYPIATEIVREEFLRKGYKLVEKPEDAGVIIGFSSAGGTTFTIDDVELNNPEPPNRIKWKSEFLEMSANMTFAPVAKNGKLVSSLENGAPENMSKIVYKRSADTIKFATVFRMMIDEWIDRFLPVSTHVGAGGSTPTTNGTVVK